MFFSERMGLHSQKPIQRECIDEETRNGLWSLITAFYWDQDHHPWARHSILGSLFVYYWDLLFKLPIDEIPQETTDAIAYIREVFYGSSWNRLFDLLELTANVGLGGDERTELFRERCNVVLQRENSAYRFVGSYITPITSDIEISSVEEALRISSPWVGVQEHLKTALAHLSARENPDYRNSIKEAICALESACQWVTGEKNATLGQAIKRVEQNGIIPRAVRDSISKLYGHASDAGGIRHGMQEKSDIDYDDAKYVLVTCTALINYMLAKLGAEGTSP